MDTLKRFSNIFPLAAIFIIGIMLASQSGARNASANAVENVMLSESPQSGWPAIKATSSDKQAFAIQESSDGSVVLAGGSFTETKDIHRNLVDTPYFVMWDSATGEILCPTLRFDHDVLAIEQGPTNETMYVGGRFNNITDDSGTHIRLKLALINIMDCKVETSFRDVQADSKITEIVYSHNRLFIGGDFTEFNKAPTETIVELNPLTGDTVNSLNVSTTGMLTTKIMDMAVSPDGNRLVVAGRFGAMSLNGTTGMQPSVVIEIGKQVPTITSHRLNSSEIPGNFVLLQDAAISPDTLKIGLAYGRDTSEDKVHLYRTHDVTINVDWTLYMRDSSFSTELSNETMFVQGHFCKIDVGSGAALMSKSTYEGECTGSRKFDGGVWRSQLVAIDIDTGALLSWNPGTDAFTGGKEMTVTENGLYIGFDGNYSGNVRTGSVAYYPYVDGSIQRNDCTVYGTSGNDTIYGTDSDDIICGGDGNDTIYGFGGNDRLFGEAGRDKLWGLEGNDFLDGEQGRDRLYGGDGNDILAGRGNKDRLVGGFGDDRLMGGINDDTVKGGAGNDFLAGNKGDDTIIGGNGVDTVKDLDGSNFCEVENGTCAEE